MILECCVDSVSSALQAASGGADRLELCSNLVIGGTTPTLALFEGIRNQLEIPIHVLIRPRFGDFLYNAEEFEIIQKEVALFDKAGAEGAVIGCLSKDGSLCMEQMKTLRAACGSMHVTLHRAFDMCQDPYKTLADAISLDIHTILTSGQQPTCSKGIDLLNALHEQAQNKITIMAGAGVNYDAVSLLLQRTNLTAFHMSGKKIVESDMDFRNPNVSMGLPYMSEYEIWQTDGLQVSAVRKLIDSQYN